VIDSEYKGVSTIGIMNLLGPDVATIGNHEVDYGLSHLLFLEKCANFPIINANFHIRANRRRLFQPFYIAEMDGMKILFIGIITEDVLAQAKVDELIGSFVDIGEAAQEVGNICNAYNAIDTFTWQLIPINNETCRKDEEMEQFINHYRVETDKKYDRIVTRFTNCLTHPARNQETALGNLIADILCDSLGIDLMLMGSGAIRSYELGPVVHYQNLVECLPYDEAVYMLQVNGEQMERMLRRILREEAFEGEHTEFYQFSHGMQITWSRGKQEFETLTLDGKVLDKQKFYTIALSKFHYMNMQKFLNISLEEIKINAPPRVLATSYRDIVEEYMMMNPHLSSEVEGRLIVKA